MLIGVPKETKNNEYRVGLTPQSVAALVEAGHTVNIETQAGLGIGADDNAYYQEGGVIVDGSNPAKRIFDTADMIVKVKEPSLLEADMLRPDQVLFTYLHLAAHRELTEKLLDKMSPCFAYECVTSPAGGYPMLTAMSKIAGRMAVQIGAHYLERPNGGRGILLGGAVGAERAQVVVLGAGTVGTAAVEIAIGMRAHVTVMDISPDALKYNELLLGQGYPIKTILSTPETIAEHVSQADLVIGAVLVPGAKAPIVVPESVVQMMKTGAVIVDVAIDQGGCIATSRPTTHDHPIFYEHGVLHYCVPNMPGAVPYTSTYALNETTLPYIFHLANAGWKQAIRADAHLMNGLNVCHGYIMNKAIAETLGYPYSDPSVYFDSIV